MQAVVFAVGGAVFVAERLSQTCEVLVFLVVVAEYRDIARDLQTLAKDSPAETVALRVDMPYRVHEFCLGVYGAVSVELHGSAG